MPVNRIITRGLGTSRGQAGRAGLVTQGYGGGFKKVIEEVITQAVIHGKSGIKKIEEIVIWAKLISVNDNPPKQNIEGYTRVPIQRSKNIATLVEHVATRVKKTWNDIHISIKLISKGKNDAR